MTANVPTMEKGSAMAGIIVADVLRRKRKITRITRAIVANIVIWMSWKAARMVFDRSLRIFTWTVGGSCACMAGSSFLTSSVTWIVFAPGCFITMRLIA